MTIVEHEIVSFRVHAMLIKLLQIVTDIVKYVYFTVYFVSHAHHIASGHTLFLPGSDLMSTILQYKRGFITFYRVNQLIVGWRSPK